jgi:hypothetical protein
MRQTKALSAVLSAVIFTVAGCDDAGSTVTAPGTGNAGALSSAPLLDRTTVKTKDRVQIVTATGDITAGVNQYRALLGGALNPNVVGEQPGPGGRREINWDGVLADFTNNNKFSGDFFNQPIVGRARGAVFSTDGAGFRISDQGFIEVNQHYEGEFNAFSPKKLFVADGSTTITVRFFVAGTNTPGLVTGFGSVFEDVGRANSTTIEYFDAAGNRLTRIAVPRRSDANGQSFAGVVFDSQIVASVRITVGDTPLGAQAFDNVKGAGKKRDLVTTDDFIYGEPRASN